MKWFNIVFCRTGTITVVDERTYRSAVHKVNDLIRQGDYVRANSGLHAMRGWLRYELHTGPKRKRVKVAARLEQAELWQEQIREAMGIGAAL